MNLMERFFGGLTKLTITSQVTEEVFTAMYNPDSFSETFSTQYQPVNNIESEEQKQNFVKNNPQSISLKLIIDGTGVTSSDPISLSLLKPKSESVFDQINRFLKMAWYFDSTKKDDTPDLLCITWWEGFKYYCHLSKVNITYTFFDKDGSPLRAELDVTFMGDKDENKTVYINRFANKKSGIGEISFSGETDTESNTGTDTDSGDSDEVSGENGIVISIS